MAQPFIRMDKYIILVCVQMVLRKKGKKNGLYSRKPRKDRFCENSQYQPLCRHTVSIALEWLFRNKVPVLIFFSIGFYYFELNVLSAFGNNTVSSDFLHQLKLWHVENTGRATFLRKFSFSHCATKRCKKSPQKGFEWSKMNMEILL